MSTQCAACIIHYVYAVCSLAVHHTLCMCTLEHVVYHTLCLCMVDYQCAGVPYTVHVHDGACSVHVYLCTVEHAVCLCTIHCTCVWWSISVPVYLHCACAWRSISVPVYRTLCLLMVKSAVCMCTTYTVHVHSGVCSVHVYLCTMEHAVCL